MILKANPTYVSRKLQINDLIIYLSLAVLYSRYLISFKETILQVNILQVCAMHSF
jgi:hypothetical protein